jgi:hypothetical protein
MREIDRLYNEVEMLANKLASYTLQDLRKLKDPERDSLIEVYDLLVQTLSCLNDASQYRKKEVSEKKNDSYGIAWPSRDDIDFSKVHASYTCEQGGEEVPEGTPIDNSNHTYFTGDERKFIWDIANAITHLTKSNTINYDDFTASLMGSEIIIRRKS